MGKVLNEPGTSGGPLPRIRQTTLKNRIHCSGIGLHGGAAISMTLHPAPADTGIVFRRLGVSGAAAEVAARFDSVADTRLCTTIANESGTAFSTIEHLMAAFAGCEIDNAIVELDAAEVPVMDGSSEPFVFLIDCAGTTVLDRARRVIEVVRPVAFEAENGLSKAALAPADRFSLDVEIDFPSRAIGCQGRYVELTPSCFREEISRARTFGFLHEVEALQKAGLARGGSLENAVVIDGDDIVNAEGLRYADEFVRHKLLDAIGDLYLAGARLRGAYTASCPGHAANNALLRKVFAEKDCWLDLPADEAFDSEWNRAIA